MEAQFRSSEGNENQNQNQNEYDNENGIDEVPTLGQREVRMYEIKRTMYRVLSVLVCFLHLILDCRSFVSRTVRRAPYSCLILRQHL